MASSLPLYVPVRDGLDGRGGIAAEEHIQAHPHVSRVELPDHRLYIGPAQGFRLGGQPFPDRRSASLLGLVNSLPLE